MVCPLRRAFFSGSIMHVIQYSTRIYTVILFCLCAAVLLAPSLAVANEYWSVLEKRFIPSQEVPNAVKEMLGHEVKRPTGTNISVTNQPTYTTNPTGGLSATTNNILRNMGQPSTFSSTINNSVNAAKTALKSCVRSPSCAGRSLGGGAIIYDGIKGWKDVYDLTLGDDDTIYRTPETLPAPTPSEPEVYVPPYHGEQTPNYLIQPAFQSSHPERYGNCQQHLNFIIASCEKYPTAWIAMQCAPSATTNNVSVNFVGFYPPDSCQYDISDAPASNKNPRPVSPEELDDLIDEGYEPKPSDAPIIFLSDSQPQSIELSTPAPVQLPSTTTTNTSSSGTTTTVTNKTINYTVSNNNSPSPSINSSTTSNTITYDSNSNVVDTSTSTTTETGVQHDEPPRVPAPPAASAPVELDFELPSFCSWASIVCDWIGWTQEELAEEEPDLTDLITVFEPDEGVFDVGIGSGACPAPMMLNLGIINKAVEVKYDPFCSFLEMIRPFVLAAAYLFAAYMYLGVLRRG